ncbi:glycosyltransferase family 4 protein [Candidatus Woesearchaeota archaeon]|nr:glycosyltransferase family 4 protein [Candidatus Woesearchaeota archaeon]
MKVLMFGWEFPPHSSGGLGTACYGLTKAMSRQGIEITFVLPYDVDTEEEFLRLISPNLKIKRIHSALRPYLTSESYSSAARKGRKSMPAIYGASLFEEVYRYGEEARKIAEIEDFDIIHCHDWMTFKAGINAKAVKGKPLVVQVHSTEFDRTGGHGVNQYVYDLEKEGMEKADAVIAVSNYTKKMIVKHYGINPGKIFVVHNAVERRNGAFRIKSEDKIVLFLGRITLQKGPEYFLYAAKKVLEKDPNVKFIVAGKGDMERFIISKAAELGIGMNVLFAGFLKGDDIYRAYSMADLYVMPSVSEPFGITALEAINAGTPVLISKQSGVSEVIKHCLVADFWDINDLANKILAVLKYGALHRTLKEHGYMELNKISWDDSARKCIDIYRRFA